MDKNVFAIGYAIAAAAFYALNVPCSKMLLAHISPVFMAGLLYIGAGLGMVLLDIAAPILLMFGVKYGTSSNASLLGNFEIVATTLIALFIFREKVSTRLWIAILFITTSSFILSFENTDGFNFSIGSIVVSLTTSEMNFAVKYIPLALLLGFVAYDTLVRSHSHMHQHIFSHTHGGITHTHVVTHSHLHNHVFSDAKHGHSHDIKDLEKISTH